MSKLTKKDCIEALKELSRLRCLAKEEYDREEHAIIMLEQLINEHFEIKEKVGIVQRSLGEIDMFELLEAIIDYDRVNGNQPCFPIKDKFRIITDEDYDKLSPLLDNKPYEFEELEVNMWVWDKETKEYKQVDYTTVIKATNEEYVYWKDPSYIFSYDFETCEDKFEPNRFYPKEVKDNESSD